MENESVLFRRRKIGDRLRQERQRLKKSQTDFSMLAHVSKTTQVNYECGERAPDVDYLAEIAGLVDVLFVVTGTRQSHGSNGVLDEAVLATILKAIEQWEMESGKSIDFAMRARLIVLFYAHAMGQSGLESGWMQKTLRAMK